MMSNATSMAASRSSGFKRLMLLLLVLGPITASSFRTYERLNTTEFLATPDAVIYVLNDGASSLLYGGGVGHDSAGGLTRRNEGDSSTNSDQSHSDSKLSGSDAGVSNSTSELPDSDMEDADIGSELESEMPVNFMAIPNPDAARRKQQSGKQTRPKPYSIVPAGQAPHRRTCSHPQIRYPWHRLSHDERRHYIDAELCLMRLPAKTRNPGVRTRWDDLQSVHQTQADTIHFTGHFLPFHRLILHVHEHMLRHECGFKGTMPYWDETRDAGAFSKSELLDPHHGFGGNGHGPKHCVKDGPFASYTLHVGPGRKITNHCLSRKIDNPASAKAITEKIQACLNLSRYDSAWPCIEGDPHTAGHFGIGGEMGNAISSPGDPLFYLHHAFIDKIWWQWQKKNLDVRLREIAGFTTQKRPRNGWTTAKLEDRLYLHGLMPDHTIAEVMDIMGANGPLCYDYA